MNKILANVLALWEWITEYYALFAYSNKAIFLLKNPNKSETTVALPIIAVFNYCCLAELNFYTVRDLLLIRFTPVTVVPDKCVCKNESSRWRMSVCAILET